MAFGRVLRLTLTWATLHSMCVSLAWAQCQVDQFATQPNFDVNKFMGTWYEMNWLPAYFADPADYWIDYVETYSVNELGTEVLVKAKGRVTADRPDCVGYERILKINADDPSRMSYVSSYNDTEKVNLDYWVMATDYNNWAYVYGCDWLLANGTCHKAHGWVWSRKITLGDDHKAAANTALEATCVSLSDFVVLPQQKSCLEASGSASRVASALFAVTACLMMLTL